MKKMKKAVKTAVKKIVRKTVRKAAPKAAVKAKAKTPVAVKTPVAAKPRPAVREPLTRQEVAEIAAQLNEMKTDIAKNVADKKNLDMLEPEVGDSIDQATQSLDKEILFELSDNERKMLRDIESALRKMEKNTYGICEHCKDLIEKKRIKALPSARYCMACQSGSEKNRAE
jgi:DnaK suppressor protein